MSGAHWRCDARDAHGRDHAARLNGSLQGWRWRLIPRVCQLRAFLRSGGLTARGRMRAERTHAGRAWVHCLHAVTDPDVEFPIRQCCRCWSLR